MRVRTVIMTVLLVSAGNHHPAQAEPQGLDPTKELSQYTHEVWLRKQGMPQNSARAILQTSDGYLWIGTEEGLARFDGVRFVVYDSRNTPGVTDKSFRALYQTSNGWLWAGTDGGLVRFDGSSWKTFTPSDGLPGETITALHEDSKKRLWIGTTVGLCFLRDTAFQVIHGRAGVVSGITSIVEDAAGNLLVGTSEGLFVEENGVLRERRVLGIEGLQVLAMTRSNDGAVWVGTRDHGLIKIESTGGKQYTRKDGLSSNRVTSVFCSANGAVWIGTIRAGLNRLVSGRISSTDPGATLSSSEIRSITEDFEGNLWVGTFGNGLHRLSDGKFTTHVVSPNAENNVVWTVHEDQWKRLFAGTADGKVYKKEGDNFRPFLDFSKPEVKWVQSLLVDRSGALWVGLSKGLFMHRNGSLRRILDDQVNTHALFEDRQGTVWAGTNNGLYKIEPVGITRITPDQGLAGMFVRVIKEDKRGDIWIGTSRGLSQLSQGKFRNFTTENGFASNSIASILIGEEGELWIGTLGGGLARFKDGKITSYTSREGLADDNVYEILDGDDGYLWMSCNNGVFRLSKKQLAEFAQGTTLSVTSELFGDSDGMLSSECNGGNQPSGWRSSDGRLWFGSIMGVVSVNPRTMPRNELPPVVSLEELLIDRVQYTLKDGISIPSGSRDFQFNFTALSFVAPGKVRFKFMLEGFDETWIDAGARRSAFYNNIPSGSYRFRVIAANNDGVWNETGVSAGFTLEPFFYQTTWFFGFCALVVISGTWRGFRIYQNHQHRKLVSSELETQLAKAQLQTLRMQLQPHFLFNTLNGIMVLIKKNPQGARAMLSQLSDLLRLTLEHQDTQEVSLEQELEILRKYLKIESARFHDRLSVSYDIHPDATEAMVPTFVLQPLVENSIKHGLSREPGPASICVSAGREDGMLILKVWDSGSASGLKPNGTVREGLGLKNTRARLFQLYGKEASLNFGGSGKGGVELIIRIPFRKGRSDTNEEKRWIA